MPITTPTAAGFTPLVLKNGDLILGDVAAGTNFKCQLRGVTLTPSVDVQTTKTACPAGQYSAADDPSWTLDLGYLYGRHADADEQALGRYLLNQSGNKMPFLFRPWAGLETYGYTGVVLIIPGALGGTYGAFSEQSVSLPLDGQPLPLTADPEEG